MKIDFFPKDNRGWIKIVEAFVAILLIAGVLLFILDKGYIKKDDPSQKIYNVENSILREIQNNDSIRIEILNQTLPTPIESNDSLFPEGVKTIINIERPSYLNCKAKICSFDDDCLLSDSISGDVYARSVPITSTITNYNPRQLKIFCW